MEIWRKYQMIKGKNGKILVREKKKNIRWKNKENWKIVKWKK